jgi:hypothetical protein
VLKYRNTDLGVVPSLQDDPDAVTHVVVLHHVNHARDVGHLQQHAAVTEQLLQSTDNCGAILEDFVEIFR